MNINFTHIRLLVPDMAASVKFYRDQLGLEVTFGGEDDEYTEFKSGESVLSLYRQDLMSDITGISNKSASADIQDRVLFSVAVDNVDEAYRSLTAKGIKFIVPPTDRAPWGLRTAHFRDHDGNLIEIGHSIPME
jgi:catechol 2,3-dioxygenase-like lactoylglutathione lyase family enzyme